MSPAGSCIHSHEQPRIVVQPETNGTPCRITTGRIHEFKEGTCRDSVCQSTALHHNKLNRKKRFICLYSLVKLFKEKRKLNALREEVSRLENGVASRSSRVVNTFSGRGVDARRTSSSGTTGSGSSNIVRIFVHSGGAHAAPRNIANTARLEGRVGRGVGNTGGTNGYSVGLERSSGGANEPAFSDGYNFASPLIGGRSSGSGGSGIGSNRALAVNGPPGTRNRMRDGRPVASRGLTIGTAGLGGTGVVSPIRNDDFSSGFGAGGRNFEATSLGMSNRRSTGMSIPEPSGVSNALESSVVDSRFTGNVDRAGGSFTGRAFSSINSPSPPVSNAAGGRSSLGSGVNRVNDGTRTNSDSGAIESRGSSVPSGGLFEVDNA